MMRAIFLFVFTSTILYGQGVLPSFRYHVYQGPLDRLETSPSFGLSLRQLSLDYEGFAARIRRSSDNASADVFFDEDRVVSPMSMVVEVATGDTILLSTFRGGADMFVEIWYDQSGNAGFNAVQNIRGRQPELRFNTAGTASDKPSIVFDGTDWLEILQPVENVLGGSIRGTFVLWTRPTRNKAQFSFGSRRPGDWRWTFHINWSDGFVYFDAAEVCCAGNRRFFNSPNLNAYNSYVFVRGNAYKTVRLSGAPTALNNSPAASTTATGGEFWIGYANFVPGAAQRYEGNLTEVLMFPVDLTLDRIQVLEQDQIDFWQ